MRIVIVGGHLSPALGVIDELPKETQVLFIGRKHTFEGDSATSLEYNTVTSLKIPFVSIATGRLQRKFTKYTILSLLKIPFGFIQSFFILHFFKPDVVLGFGGYLSVPVVIIAFLMHVPIVIHEQTLEVGLSNKISSIFAKKICISWESSRKFFPKDKTVFTGNPIRKLKIKNEKLKIKNGKHLPIIYITGGSSGSHFINSLVKDCIKQLLEKFIVIHQTGESKYKDFENLENLRNKLPKEFKDRYVLKKFIDSSDMGSILQIAILVISRSGINTITELICFKKKALLIPITFAQNNEQLKNALFFKDLGLGEMLAQESLDSNKFLQKVKEMLNNIDKYKIKDKTNTLIHKNAAKKIIEVVEYVEKKKKD